MRGSMDHHHNMLANGMERSYRLLQCLQYQSITDKLLILISKLLQLLEQIITVINNNNQWIIITCSLMAWKDHIIYLRV